MSLADKEEKSYDGEGEEFYYYPKKDVKEFIKKILKKKICRYCGCKNTKEEPCHHTGTETLYCVKVEDIKKEAVGEKKHEK